MDLQQSKPYMKDHKMINLQILIDRCPLYTGWVIYFVHIYSPLAIRVITLLLHIICTGTMMD